MPYIYNSSALLSASVSDNLQPITVPPVNRYLYPIGLELNATSTTGLGYRHQVAKGIQFVPIKVASTITLDRIGMFIQDTNSCVDTWTYNLGLYTHNSTDNYPNTQIADFGTITFDGGVTPTGVQLITINQTLNANTTYWLAIGINVDATNDTSAGRTPYVAQLNGDYAMFRKRGISAANSGGLGMAWAHSLGSYAGTLPASVSYSSNSASLPACIRTPLRRSA
jgi:hypothetical protein